MASPLRNPFYPALLAACATLLITMLVYLMGWMYVPNPDAASGPRAPMPGWMRWIDANALPLIGIEVAVIGALTILMISLDHRFDPPQDHSG